MLRSNAIASSIRLSRTMNADTAQAMGRGIGRERLCIANEIENRRGSSTIAIADDIGAGCQMGMRSESRVVVVHHPLTWHIMASSLGRLARLTLFSGPNCSLCDVRCSSSVVQD